ncbi:hypothetical protein [Streptomyces sp. NPDC051079]|uniref:hypothetical protein n=1 Tax=Streptomyces sp. NPDC051079 TaxID=3155043 RepID=UPI00344D82D4
MLTYDNVLHAPLGRLKGAADHWSEMQGRLDRLAEDARTGMAAKAEGAYWRGVNAEVTKPFVDKTAKEFADAAKSAGGIQKILQEGYAAFKKAQDDLKGIAGTEAPAQGLVVTSAGVVQAQHPIAAMNDAELRRDPDYPALIRKEEEAIGAMQQRIDAVLETCEDADVACSNALRADITSDRHNFSAPTYSGLDAEEARRAVDLAKKGRGCPHRELAQLNEPLAESSSSGAFARAFYDGLAAKAPWSSSVGSPRTRSTTARWTLQRLADVQELQVHSIMLPTVKKLGCADNAGLPERPVIKARKATGGRP